MPEDEVANSTGEALVWGFIAFFSEDVYAVKLEGADRS
mgnify:CR=1 FL=1